MNGFINKPCDELELAEALQYTLAHPPSSQMVINKLAGKRILVADDNQQNRQVLRAYLQRVDCKVVEAEHGVAVMSCLSQQSAETPKIDAIIMDMHMPGLDGIETVKAIRTSGAAYKDIPVIALSGDFAESVIAEAKAAGFNEFLSKPIDSERLFNTLAIQLSGGLIIDAEANLLIESPASDADNRVVQTLNHSRLLDFKNGKMLHILNAYVAQLDGLPEKIEAYVKTKNLKAATDATHILLGTSGDAGALELYNAVRSFYVPMAEEKRWPKPDNWVALLKSLRTVAVQAIREQYLSDAALIAEHEKAAQRVNATNREKLSKPVEAPKKQVLDLTNFQHTYVDVFGMKTLLVDDYVLREYMQLNGADGMHVLIRKLKETFEELRAATATASRPMIMKLMAELRFLGRHSGLMVLSSLLDYYYSVMEDDVLPVSDTWLSEVQQANESSIACLNKLL